MSLPISRDTLDRLVALGRRQGHLTTGDLARALPVEAMSADEVALVVVQLEDAGVSVELDESLLAPAQGARSIERLAGEIVLPVEQGQEAPKSRETDAGALTPAAATASRDSSPRTAPSVHWAVVLAGVLVLVLLLLAIFAFGR